MGEHAAPHQTAPDPLLSHGDATKLRAEGLPRFLPPSGERLRASARMTIAGKH